MDHHRQRIHALARPDVRFLVLHDGRVLLVSGSEYNVTSANARNVGGLGLGYTSVAALKHPPVIKGLEDIFVETQTSTPAELAAAGYQVAFTYAGNHAAAESLAPRMHNGASPQ